MGKAKRFNAYDKSIHDSRRIAENYANNRQTASGITSSLSSIPRGKPLKTNTPNRLDTTFGGIIAGPIAFTQDTSKINSIGELDISVDNTITPKLTRGFVYVTPFSGTSDTINVIYGKKYDGQMIMLSSLAGNTITITHGHGAAGQVLCPGDSDYTLSDDESIILVHDTINATQPTWRIVATSNASGGSGMNDLVDDTTPQLGGNLDLNGFHIYGDVGEKYFFDGGVDTYMTGSATSGRINVYNNSTNVTAFGTFGLLTTNITCADITTTGDIDINGNLLYLDSDRDTSISSTSDDNIQFTTGASVRVSLSNSAITSTIPLTMGGNDINGVDILYFQDPSSGAIPTSGSVGIGAVTGDMYLNVLSADSYFFRVAGTTEVEIDADGIDIRNGWLELEERSAPSGLSNHARLYAKDNGAGKTQLVVIFGSGAEQVIATEP
jgi:hypothetical protein